MGASVGTATAHSYDQQSGQALRQLLGASPPMAASHGQPQQLDGLYGMRSAKVELLLSTSLGRTAASLDAPGAEGPACMGWVSPCRSRLILTLLSTTAPGFAGRRAPWPSASIAA